MAASFDPTPQINELRDACLGLMAENLAMQAIVAHLCRRLGALDPRFREAALQAFDDAANAFEMMAMIQGRSAPRCRKRSISSSRSGA